MIATLTPFLSDVNFTIPEIRRDGSFDASELPSGLLALAGGAVSPLNPMFCAELTTQ
jgi:hypothetical protein